jgi:hypothetical protein
VLLHVIVLRGHVYLLVIVIHTVPAAMATRKELYTVHETPFYGKHIVTRRGGCDICFQCCL